MSCYSFGSSWCQAERLGCTAALDRWLNVRLICPRIRAWLAVYSVFETRWFHDYACSVDRVVAQMCLLTHLPKDTRSNRAKT